MFVKVTIIASVVIAVVALVLILPSLKPFREFLFENAPSQLQDYLSPYEIEEPEEDGSSLMTKEELMDYDGDKGSLGLYIAVLGKVFDVSEGAEHYGPKGNYHYFAGKDATRAYVTGSPEDLHDDVSDFNPHQMLQLDNWLKFYEKKYRYIGKVIGAFYDVSGRSTRLLSVVKRRVEKAKELEKKMEVNMNLYPNCNAMWSQEDGSVVWCTKESGGVKRDWAGLPRQYFEPGAKSPRCACVRSIGPPTGAWKVQTDNGDLDDPNLRLYDGCDPLSPLCKLPENI